MAERAEARAAERAEARAAERRAALAQSATSGAATPFVPAPAVTPRPRVKLIEVAPAARPAQMKLRHWLIILSFIVVVILPTAGAGVYLYTWAADQYASKVGFTVRREESSSAMEILGGLTSLSSASSSDTDILYEFIQGQKLVRAIDDDLDLRALYSRPENDPYFRLAPDASIEELVEYWEKMARIYYAPGTGLIEVEIRAFRPDDAKAIAEALFRHSSTMINDLSNIARIDTTRYAKEELDIAVDRLKSARQALTRFRNEKRIVDPSADIQGQTGLITSLQAQLAGALIDLDMLSASTRDSDPRVEQAKRRIEVIERRIEEERRKLGASSGEAYADLVGEFEVLKVDMEFAEKTYFSALSTYDGALSEAGRQSRYLAAYLEPTLAEKPEYPKRLLDMAILALILFGIWTIMVLIYYSLKDRR